jgi:hypothetical protein
MTDKEKLAEQIKGFLNGDRETFTNTHKVFMAINEVVNGTESAILTDDILERYCNEEYFDRSILED